MVTLTMVEIDMTAIRELTNSRKKMKCRNEGRKGEKYVDTYFEKKICQREVDNFCV